ncbi:MAG: hypothetical protein AAFQ94_17465 [Bacteroidota bacterium]
MKDDFYIGWQDKAPKGFGRKGLFFFLGALLIAVLFTVIYVPSQQKFSNSIFEYGSLTELKGQLVDYPVIGLSTTVDGEKITVPLVGFGKKGADAVMEHLVDQLESPVAAYEVTLRGTLIKYNGKVWMELTEENESILSYSRNSASAGPEVVNLGQQKIVGEIVDPKCFFGVMKPGFGKIHRSCAVRCISGGIPPVLAVRQGNRYVDYYFLTNQNGNHPGRDILKFVGKSVTINGEVEQVNDWKNIRLGSDNIQNQIAMLPAMDIAVCK